MSTIFMSLLEKSKITRLFVDYHNGQSTWRSMKCNPNAKAIYIFGIDWKYYFYAKSWHLIHTNEEKRDKYFYCLLCQSPDFFIHPLRYNLKYFYYSNIHDNFFIKKIRWNVLKLKCYLLHQDINEVLLIKILQHIKELKRFH